MKKYDKLVRDRIPEIIEADGKKCTVEIVDDKKALEYLYIKLREETDELLEDKNIDEAADVMEVVFAIAEKYGYSEEELLEHRKNKKDKRGGFKNNIILKEVN